MRCDEVHEYLAERLAGSLSDRLSGTVHSHVRTHMLSCPECCEELEDFEEMQTVLRSIPLEPCDPNAMRARFDLLTGATEIKEPRIPAIRLWPLPRPIKIFLSATAVAGVLAIAVLAVRQAGIWRSVNPKPAAAPIQTGAMSGQVRTANGEARRKVRVAVIAVPSSGAPPKEIAVETTDDGRYRLDNIPAGRYYVLASSVEAPTYYPGSPDTAGATIVSIQPGVVLNGIDFTRLMSSGKSTSAVVSSEISEISGRVLLEDGSELSDPLVLGELAIRAADSSSDSSASIVKLEGSGRFSRSLAADEYRFRIAVFSQDYVIRSMTAGDTDLLKDNLKVSGSLPVAVEIRVGHRISSGAGKILGTVVDAVTNSPSQADRVVLCCFASGPAERLSTPLHADGTFEFNDVPSGPYTAELRGSKSLVVANPSIDVTAAGAFGVKLFSAPQMRTIDVTLKLDTGDRLPYKPDSSIVFTGTTGGLRVAASCVVGNLFRASVPANESFALAVSNIASGYTVRSIVDDNKTDLLHGGLFSAASPTTAPSRIVITLAQN